MREKEIKRMTRKQKIKLIESMNPDWQDLSREQNDPVAESGISLGRLGTGSRAAATRGNDNRG